MKVSRCWVRFRFRPRSCHHKDYEFFADYEYALGLLEETGLRRILLGQEALDDSHREVRERFLERTPLESFPLGEGTKATAHELGI